MIPVKVNTTFQGRVAIRDKYIKEAEETNQGIMIGMGDEYMIMPCWKIPNLIKARSPYPVKDRFSRDSHYLIYFDWRPTGGQRRLFTLEAVKSEG